MNKKKKTFSLPIFPIKLLPRHEVDPDYYRENRIDLNVSIFKDQKPGYITANPYTYPIIKDFRKDLKDHQTPAELKIWKYLRNQKTGYKIRRQHVIGDFIVDFVCLLEKKIIEFDGPIHQFKKKQDKIRTDHLWLLGYEIIR
ncbi:MAG: DUF559 domain-containing protein, partial [Bacteroidia bacterium]|nr:DUF559 domain-containing protein [Bacteroidia bacterium]